VVAHMTSTTTRTTSTVCKAGSFHARRRTGRRSVPLPRASGTRATSWMAS
jgi:hypothetical protein